MDLQSFDSVKPLSPFLPPFGLRTGSHPQHPVQQLPSRTRYVCLTDAVGACGWWRIGFRKKAKLLTDLNAYWG